MPNADVHLYTYDQDERDRIRNNARDTPCPFVVPRCLVTDASAVCYQPSSFAIRSASSASRV